MLNVKVISDLQDIVMCRCWHEGTTEECTRASMSGCRTSLTATTSSIKLFHISFCLWLRAITAPLRPHRARLVRFLTIHVIPHTDIRRPCVFVYNITVVTCPFLLHNRIFNLLDHGAAFAKSIQQLDSRTSTKSWFGHFAQFVPSFYRDENIPNLVSIFDSIGPGVDLVSKWTNLHPKSKTNL